MSDTQVLTAMEAHARRRDERRSFFRDACGALALGGGLFLTGRAAAQNAAPTDADVLNFALNLEYLEAQFYVQAAFGTALPDDLTGGAGTRGAATGGRQVAFTDPLVRQYAVEIAQDERNHVAFLRSALGNSVVAQPAIDISPAPNGAFSSAARAAGLIGPGQSFDPYANDENFLLAAYIFEDVGVTAYKGAAPLITNKTFLEASAGLLAIEAYHAALIRTVLYGKGVQMPMLRTATVAISDARDSLDGPTDLDQGVIGTPETSNIAPLDADGLAFGRTTGQVLNIVYLSRMMVSQGGFFPAGVNGTIRTSAAN